MRAIALGLALTTLFASALADVYKVQHRRPSALLANLLVVPHGRVYTITGGNSFVPGGVTVTADDSASTITIDGPQSGIENMKAILAEFDVAPRQVTVRITIRSEADKYESTTVTQVNNNAGWTLDDNTTGVKLELIPRINGDGTVTGTFEVSDSSLLSKFVTRTKMKEPIQFGLSDGGHVPAGKLWFDGKNGVKAEHEAPSIQISVSFEIASSPNEGTSLSTNRGH